MAEDHVHIRDGKWDVRLYGPPNKVLGSILMGDRVAAIVGDYTKKVAASYSAMLGARSTGKSGGGLVSTIQAGIHPNDGYKGDRWIGEVSVGSESNPYGAADEFGRNRYAAYQGRSQLEDALRMNLPHKP